MPVEIAQYFAQLNANAPTNSDFKYEGDDQLRLLKGVLQTQFPNLGVAAPVNPTALELNTLVGINTGSTLAAQIAALAPLASPLFTGNPRVPTVAQGNNSTTAASTAYVDAGLQAVIASSLPSQPGNQGRVLTTNGSTSSWGTALVRSEAAAFTFQVRNSNAANGSDAQVEVSTGAANSRAVLHSYILGGQNIGEIFGDSGLADLRLSLSNGAYARLITSTSTFETNGQITSLSSQYNFGIANYNIGVFSGDPIFNFDINDFQRFQRASNTYDWVIGGAQRFTLSNTQALFQFADNGVDQLRISNPSGTSGVGMRLVGNGATTPTKYIRAFNGNLEFVNDAYSFVAFQMQDNGRTFIRNPELGTLKEVGYRGMPPRATLDANSNGTYVPLTAGITINANVHAAEDLFGLYNNSASAITITQGAGLTLRQGGTSNTGNRTLQPFGYATCLVRSGTEIVLYGNVT